MIYYYTLEQGISNLGAILVCTKVESYSPPNWCWARNAGSQNGWKSSLVRPKDEAATIEREFQFRKKNVGLLYRYIYSETK